MKGLFQRHAPGSEPGSARLTLGAFGKHPGWDDHILGIGVETETLAQLKQLLFFLAIPIIFYFALLRPQQKRAKETAEMLKTVKSGDKIVTTLRPAKGGQIQR